MKKYQIAIIVVLIILGLYFFTQPTGLTTEEIAKCLSDSGAKMYGAYWCGHCNDQKEMFGEYWKLINYVECQGDGVQNEECKEAGITGYPTWIFGDGERISGARPISNLASIAGC